MTGILGAITALLVFANVCFLFLEHHGGHDYVYGFARLFRLNKEMNVPSFFSGCLLLVNAVLFLLVWRARRGTSAPRWIWCVLAGVFLFLAYDELFSVHESLAAPLHRMLDLTGLWFFAWFIVYGAGVVLLAVLFFSAWRRLNRRIRIWLGLALACYLVGAIGLEMIEGALYESTASETDLLYVMLTIGEEALEMAGLVALTHGLLSLLQTEGDGFALEIPPASPRASRV